MFTLGLILILGIPFSYGCVAMVQDGYDLFIKFLRWGLQDFD